MQCALDDEVALGDEVSFSDRIASLGDRRQLTFAPAECVQALVVGAVDLDDHGA
jgi:hypothetical protein